MPKIRRSANSFPSAPPGAAICIELRALRRALAAGVVDGVLAGEQKLGDGEEGIALLQQRLDDARQGFWSVQGGVMEQDDGAGLDLACHPLGDLRRGQLLPVQTVPAGKGCKRLEAVDFTLYLQDTLGSASSSERASIYCSKLFIILWFFGLPLAVFCPLDLCINALNVHMPILKAPAVLVPADLLGLPT